jgi:hypothetical protein
MDEPPIAFVNHVYEPPGLELRVNFGVFAGREATPAEIDELAAHLLASTPEVSIISEQRHEISRDVEASLHQVRIELSHDLLPQDYAALDSLERYLLDEVESWAKACVAERHAEVTEF